MIDPNNLREHLERLTEEQFKNILSQLKVDESLGLWDSSSQSEQATKLIEHCEQTDPKLQQLREILNKPWELALSLLQKLMNPQFALVIANYPVPHNLLSTKTSQTEQAIEVIRYAEQNEGAFLERLIQVIYDVAPHLMPPSAQVPDDPDPLKKPKWLQRIVGLVLVLTGGLLSSGGVTALVLEARKSEVFQKLEAYAYDQMMQNQKSEEKPPIFVIQVIPTDIKEQEKKDSDFQPGISLTNSRLLRILKRLMQENRGYEPKVIGLDLIRDFSAKNNKELTRILEKDQRIVAACYIGKNDQTAGPPPEVPRERLGFIDVYKDDNIDGILRRQPLVFELPKDSKCKSKSSSVSGNSSGSTNETMNSFALEIAQRFLEEKDKKPDKAVQIENEDFTTLQIGDTIFEPLTSDFRGIYYSEESNFFKGHQIPLNYRKFPNEYGGGYSLNEVATKIVSVDDVLSSNFLEDNKEKIKGSIVLIGVAVDNYPGADFHTNPFDRQNKLPGYIFHAQMISQILGAVSGNHPLLQILSIQDEVIWIFSCSVFGVIIALCTLRFHKAQSLIIVKPITLVLLWWICNYSFSSHNLLMPFIPAAFALVGTVLVIVIVYYYLQDTKLAEKLSNCIVEKFKNYFKARLSANIQQ